MKRSYGEKCNKESILCINASCSDGKSSLAAPYRQSLEAILVYTRLLMLFIIHFGAHCSNLGSLPSTRISWSVVSHQKRLGHILAHQSLELKMLTQKYTDGYWRKMETLQNICGACSKLCLADPLLPGRACKSPWGNPGYIVLVGREGEAIKAAISYLL